MSALTPGCCHGGHSCQSSCRDVWELHGETVDSITLWDWLVRASHHVWLGFESRRWQRAFYADSRGSLCFKICIVATAKRQGELEKVAVRTKITQYLKHPLPTTNSTTYHLPVQSISACNYLDKDEFRQSVQYGFRTFKLFHRFTMLFSLQQDLKTSNKAHSYLNPGWSSLKGMSKKF
jgi:hypothetical protein